MRIKINYAKLDFQEFEITKHNKLDSALTKIFVKCRKNSIKNILSNDMGIVFLVDVLGETFVSTDCIMVHNFIEIQVLNTEQDNVEISVHEYHSFESAYRNALRLKETSNLCYDKSN